MFSLWIYYVRFLTEPALVFNNVLRSRLLLLMMRHVGGRGIDRSTIWSSYDF